MKLGSLAILTIFLVGVGYSQEDKRIEITLGGNLVTNFYYGPQWDKPFLHPIRTVEGQEISRVYPLGHREGEREDHVWHRGIWFSHGDINGVDFWRELGPGKTGKLVIKGEPTLEERGDTVTLTAEMDVVTPDNKAIGTIRQEFVFSQTDGNNIIDAHMTFVADQGIPLKLGDTEEGTFAIRLTTEFTEGGGVTILNSDGLAGTKAVWGKRARWTDYSSNFEGHVVGIAILDHPDNPKHPPFWHARGYGLNAANPFGEHDFTGDATRDGSRVIPAGGMMDFRYRVIIHRGDAETAGVADHYAAYAASRK